MEPQKSLESTKYIFINRDLFKESISNPTDDDILTDDGLKASQGRKSGIKSGIIVLKQLNALVNDYGYRIALHSRGDKDKQFGFIKGVEQEVQKRGVIFPKIYAIPIVDSKKYKGVLSSKPQVFTDDQTGILIAAYDNPGGLSGKDAIREALSKALEISQSDRHRNIVIDPLVDEASLKKAKQEGWDVREGSLKDIINQLYQKEQAQSTTKPSQESSRIYIGADLTTGQGNEPIPDQKFLISSTEIIAKETPGRSEYPSLNCLSSFKPKDSKLQEVEIQLFNTSQINEYISERLGQAQASKIKRYQDILNANTNIKQLIVYPYVLEAIFQTLSDFKDSEHFGDAEYYILYRCVTESWLKRQENYLTKEEIEAFETLWNSLLQIAFDLLLNTELSTEKKISKFWLHASMIPAVKESPLAHLEDHKYLFEYFVAEAIVKSAELKNAKQADVITFLSRILETLCQEPGILSFLRNATPPKTQEQPKFFKLLDLAMNIGSLMSASNSIKNVGNGLNQIVNVEKSKENGQSMERTVSLVEEPKNDEERFVEPETVYLSEDHVSCGESDGEIVFEEEKVCVSSGFLSDDDDG